MLLPENVLTKLLYVLWYTNSHSEKLVIQFIGLKKAISERTEPNHIDITDDDYKSVNIFYFNPHWIRYIGKNSFNLLHKIWS